MKDVPLLIGNLAIFGAIYYAVFFLGHSGWWFAFLLVFHFSEGEELLTHE